FLTESRSWLVSSGTTLQLSWARAVEMETLFRSSCREKYDVVAGSVTLLAKPAQNARKPRANFCSTRTPPLLNVSTIPELRRDEPQRGVGVDLERIGCDADTLDITEEPGRPDHRRVVGTV